MVQKGPGTNVQKPQASTAQTMNYEAISQDPLKHVITFIEKKIRNLDKRKAKLDGYKKMVEDGKPLDPDQTAAASKYDEVIGSLEFAKDLIKNFEATTLEVMKQQRKTSRREQIAREEAENNRVCFVVRASRIMELLHGNEFLREDFLNGANGACVVSKLELDQLVNFYELFIMKSYESGSNIVEDGNAAGNHMYELAEGRSKDIVGTTYKELHALLDRVSDIKYFEDLRSTDKQPEIHAEAVSPDPESVSSESSAEDEASEKQEKDYDETDDVETPRDTNTEETNALSPNSSEPLSSPGFSADAPLKTAEFLPSTDAIPFPVHTENDWQPKQQQQIQPEQTGDYMSPSSNFQYNSTNSSQTTQQQPSSYHTQRIQEVLAEVQGPCQFLQDSIIDCDVGGNSMMSFTAMDVHQQSLPQSTNRSHQMAPTSHVRTSAMESVFQNQQNISPIDPSMSQRSGGQKDSTHIPNTAVTHSEHLQKNDPSSAYISNMPPTDTGADNEYTMSSRKPADNLGLGQTTFGGQQQTADPRLSFSQPTKDHSSFEDQDLTPNVSYGAVVDSSAQKLGPGMTPQHAMNSPSIQAPDPPTTHIPLPNDQQSGYRSFQASENQRNETNNMNDDVKVTHEQRNVSQDQTSDINSKASPDTAAPSGGGSSPRSRQGKTNSPQQGEPGTGYNSRNSGQQQQMGQQPGRNGRGGNNYSNYRPAGQGGSGGGYNQQRGNNYRGGGRYNGSYDSMGRPGNYSGGGYQNNQSGGYGYRQQDQYPFRRGTGGGGMRGNRGRGNPRGGGRDGGSGNYNRSRTFRPQHSSEQAV